MSLLSLNPDDEVIADEGSELTPLNVDTIQSELLLKAPLTNPVFKGQIYATASQIGDLTVSGSLTLTSQPSGGTNVGDTLLCNGLDAGGSGGTFTAFLRGPVKLPGLLSSLTSNLLCWDTTDGTLSYAPVSSTVTSGSASPVTSGAVSTAIAASRVTPAGSSNQIQYNGGSSTFAASSNLTFNGITNVLTTHSVDVGSTGGALIARAQVSFPGLSSATTSNVLYWAAGGTISYGSVPTGGSSVTYGQVLYSRGTDQTIPNNSTTTVSFDSTVVAGSAISGVSMAGGVCTISTTGLYWISCNINLQTASSGQRRFFFQVTNFLSIGTSGAYSQTYQTDIASNSDLGSIQGMFYVIATPFTVQPRLFGNPGSSFTQYGRNTSSNGAPQFWVVKLA